MNLIEADNFPDTCGDPYILYAFNLEEFNEVDYSVGDTLIIQFNFTDECEAQYPTYDCIGACDIRHGIPVQIVSISLD